MGVIFGFMTILEVSVVSPDGEAAWCEGACRQGVLRPGDRLVVVRYRDGSTVQADLTVVAVETPTGPVPQLDPYVSGRVRVVGASLGALVPGCFLETVQQPQPAQPPTYPPAYPATAGQAPPMYASAILTDTDRPALSVEEAAHLRRWSTAFRLVLIIPHYIVLAAMGIAAEVIVVIGWFGALFMGRLPGFAAEFLAGYVGYQTRVYGYLFLLSDRYPAFGFSDDTFPIRVEVPPPGRLRRWSVFFRLLLVIPAAVVAGVVTGGLMVASFVWWLIVLIIGRFPPSLFLASSSILRFGLRTNAYALLLTSRYPRGLFGDAAVEASPYDVAPPPAWQATPYPPVTPAPYAQPAPAPYAQPAPAPYAQTGWPGQPYPAQPAPGQPARTFQLVLNRAAKASSCSSWCSGWSATRRTRRSSSSLSSTRANSRQDALNQVQTAHSPAQAARLRGDRAAVPHLLPTS